MDTAPHVEVRVSQFFSAPAERVFDAWIDPATAGSWLFATAWRPMTSVAIDARAGGRFRIGERKDGEGLVHSGRYIEISRPRRLVFTLADEKLRRSSSCVRVEIVPRDSGCEIRLVHEGLMPEGAAHVEGRWAGMLYGLANMLGR
jgi:uncharacterized protein YndB with AHSA1/START domain